MVCVGVGGGGLGAGGEINPHFPAQRVLWLLVMFKAITKLRDAAIGYGKIAPSPRKIDFPQTRPLDPFLRAFYTS